MTIICTRVIRTIADLREFCDAVEESARTRSWQLELSVPLEMYLTRLSLPGHRFCHDIHWDIADPEVVAEIEAAMAAEDAATTGQA